MNRRKRLERGSVRMQLLDSSDDDEENEPLVSRLDTSLLLGDGSDPDESSNTICATDNVELLDSRSNATSLLVGIHKPRRRLFKMNDVRRNLNGRINPSPREIRPCGITIRSTPSPLAKPSTESLEPLNPIDLIDRTVQEFEDGGWKRAYISSYGRYNVERMKPFVRGHHGTIVSIPLMDEPLVLPFVTSENVNSIERNIDNRFFSMYPTEYDTELSQIKWFYKSNYRNNLLPLRHRGNNGATGSLVRRVIPILPSTYRTHHHPFFYTMVPHALMEYLNDISPESRLALLCSNKQLCRLRSWCRRFEKMPSLPTTLERFFHEINDAQRQDHHMDSPVQMIRQCTTDEALKGFIDGTR